MKFIVLTHANLKLETGEPVLVSLQVTNIAGCHYSPANKCTLVYALGSIIPVLEDVQTIVTKIGGKIDE